MLEVCFLPEKNTKVLLRIWNSLFSFYTLKGCAVMCPGITEHHLNTDGGGVSVALINCEFILGLLETTLAETGLYDHSGAV